MGYLDRQPGSGGADLESAEQPLVEESELSAVIQVHQDTDMALHRIGGIVNPELSAHPQVTQQHGSSLGLAG